MKKRHLGLMLHENGHTHATLDPRLHRTHTLHHIFFVLTVIRKFITAGKGVL